MDRANDGLGALAAYRAVAGIDAAPEEFMKMAIDAARTFMLQAEAAISDGNRPAKALVPFHKDYDGLTDPLGEAGWG